LVAVSFSFPKAGFLPAWEQKISTGQQQRQQEAERTEKPSMGERFMDWVRDNHASQPSLGGELNRMTREAVKDIRATVNEVFFGKSEHASEPAGGKRARNRRRIFSTNVPENGS